MPLETAVHINDLDIANPAGTDNRIQGDNHIRMIKQVLKTDLPLTAPASATGIAVLTAATQSAARAALAIPDTLARNDIINGDFRIAQAGASFVAPASGEYDLDGWFNANPSTAVFTVAQVAGSSAGRLARQVTITTADAAVAAGDYFADVTRIEGYNIAKYVGNTFTVAFRAKVPVTGIHCVALRNPAGDRAYVKEINFPAANTWQDCSFTVIGGLPIAGTWNYTNTGGLDIWFSHMCGTTFQTTPDAWNAGNFIGTANQVNDCATVSNVWALEKVTLNLGTVAAVSDISYEQELLRCQRYFETGQLYGHGYAPASTVIRAAFTPFKATKRAAPTLSVASITYGNASGLAVDSSSLSAAGWLVNATATGSFNVDATFTALARL